MSVPERGRGVSNYGSINGPSNPEHTVAVIKLRHCEVIHEIKNLSVLITVAEFKSQVAGYTNVPVERQRLVIGGRRMEPNTALLQSFKLKENDHIYLFPLPSVIHVNNATIVINSHVTTSSQQRIQRWINIPQVTLAARELEFCCQELIAVSDFCIIMDLFYFLGAGR